MAWSATLTGSSPQPFSPLHQAWQTPNTKLSSIPSPAAHNTAPAFLILPKPSSELWEAPVDCFGVRVKVPTARFCAHRPILELLVWMEFDSNSQSFVDDEVSELRHSHEDAMFSPPFQSKSMKKRSRGVAESWIPGLLSSQFFGPCPSHKDCKKNECTYYCTTCAKPGVGHCQHCLPNHSGHDLLQIRRYVYCDVVRTADVAAHVDIAGVQTYIINQAKVIFLNHRPQSRFAKVGNGDVCKTCQRGLREGCSFCSLGCRVSDLLTSGKRLKPSPASSEEAEFDNVPSHLLARGKPHAMLRTGQLPSHAKPADDEWESMHFQRAPLAPAAHTCWLVRSRRKQHSPRRSPLA